MQYVISIIWFLLSGLLIYNVFYHNDSVSTVLYIILCWVCSAPLAGCIIHDSLKAMEKGGGDLDEEKNFTLVLFGVIIGVVVSIVDFFFVKEDSLDFFCDLVEIGFGYFALASYYVSFLLVRFLKLQEEGRRIMAKKMDGVKAMKWKQEQEELRRQQQNRNAKIEEINQILKGIIDDGLVSEQPFINFGPEGSEERYYIAEYPIKKLKPKTEQLIDNQ